MRLTIYYLAVVLLLASGTVAVDAQEATKSDARDAKPVEPSLESRLNQRIDVEFNEETLSDAVAYLQATTGIQFVINAKKLDEAGVSLDFPVNKILKQVRLTTVLDIVLDELELAYIEKDGLLIITTPEDAESKLIIRVYDCRDLIALDPPQLAKHATSATADPTVPSALLPAGDTPPKLDPPVQPPTPAPPTSQPQMGGSDHSSKPFGWMFPGGHTFPGQQPPRSDYEIRAESLIALLENTVDVNSWSRVGGAGAIRQYSGLIVVTQTSQTHKKVERVLDMLRYAAGFAGPMEEKVVR